MGAGAAYTLHPPNCHATVALPHLPAQCVSGNPKMESQPTPIDRLASSRPRSKPCCVCRCAQKRGMGCRQLNPRQPAGQVQCPDSALHVPTCMYSRQGCDVQRKECNLDRNFRTQSASPRQCTAAGTSPAYCAHLVAVEAASVVATRCCDGRHLCLRVIVDAPAAQCALTAPPNGVCHWVALGCLGLGHRRRNPRTQLGGLQGSSHG